MFKTNITTVQHQFLNPHQSFFSFPETMEIPLHFTVKTLLKILLNKDYTADIDRLQINARVKYLQTQDISYMEKYTLLKNDIDGANIASTIAIFNLSYFLTSLYQSSTPFEKYKIGKNEASQILSISTSLYAYLKDYSLEIDTIYPIEEKQSDKYLKAEFEILSDTFIARLMIHKKLQKEDVQQIETDFNNIDKLVYQKESKIDKGLIFSLLTNEIFVVSKNKKSAN